MNADIDVAPGAAPGADGQGGAAAAARLLELAARDAEAWRTEARAESEQVVQAAREQADRLVADARAEAERLHAAAETERRGLEAEVGRLREVERGHRDHLREHLSAVLAEVDKPRSEG
jgi:cell division septum initiation protein DivIVA